MKIIKLKSAILSQLAKAAAENDGAIKICNEPYMPLSCELIGETEVSGQSLQCFSMCHYGEQNGDLMRDPDVCFFIQKDGENEYFIPYEFQNDYAGEYTCAFKDQKWQTREQRDIAEFCQIWIKNLKEQGYIDQLNPDYVQAVKDFEKEPTA